MRITIVGTGYVGLVTGVCLADVGHEVVCVDTNAKKVETLRNGGVPIYEPGLDRLIARNIEHERLSFTTDLAGALVGSEIAFIAVGTPQGEDGSADLQYVLQVADDIGSKATGDITVVVKSTVPVGTCDKVEERLLAAAKKSGFKTPVASNPEFLKEGDAIDDFMKPERIVVGIEDPSIENQFKELYRPFIIDDPGRLLIMDRHSSELTKYGSNAMLATRISFMNELAQLCSIVGANVDHVRRGMGADSRIGRKFLYAGPGYGGSCFPKDVSALVRTSQDRGAPSKVLDAVMEANEAQKRYAANMVMKHFGNLTGKKIAIWGLAFKPGTDDVREAPAKTIIKELLAEGATIVAHDPQATDNFVYEEFGEKVPNSFEVAKSAYAACEGADAVVLVTEWSEYKRPNWQKLSGILADKVVFDFRNQYQQHVLKELGFAYYCIGRPDDHKGYQS